MPREEDSIVSKWDDPSGWQRLIDGSACPICVRGRPLDIIASLESSWLTMPEHAAMPGYVCLVSRVHAVELHDLTEDQAGSFVRDASQVSMALSAVTKAVKLNYEIHGNTLPHLHMHYFPRHPGDRFEGRPIDPRGVPQPVYAPGQFSELRDRLRRALDASTNR
ncbi:HIT family protein [Tundrisphaera lichenicola]|uniref:HIT family protein n=1 Tax=Tundrisphaera lichenicola TaxID=2029860 RepID=UPI003EC07494